MEFNARKIRAAMLIISFMIASGVFVVSFQEHILRAKANVSSIIVYLDHLDHLDFGQVFPGEQLQKTFSVHYSGSGNADYTIVEKYKPLPGAVVPDGYNGNISDYCQDNFSDFDRCYKTLCPFIEEYSEENEGDTVLGANVSPNDPEDHWIVAFNNNFVPAIIGNVSQDHKGDIISESGIYGCDLSFNVDNVDIEPYCGDGNKDANEQCDDGNNINGDGCSSVCNNEGGGGGGGGGGLVSLQINDAEDCVVAEDGVYFSWRTNMTSSSRVVCDTEPNPNWGTPPDYGYFLYTDEFNLSPRILNHEVKITGLVAGESYYCRVISSNSSSTVFEEVICSTPEEEEEKGKVKGVIDIIIPEALPKTGFGSVVNEIQNININININIIATLFAAFIFLMLLQYERRKR